MRHFTSSLTIAAITALAIAGCSSGQADHAGELTPADTAVQADTSPRMHKEIGERAGVGSPDNPQLVFTVDDISTSPTCPGPGANSLDGQAEGQFLAVDMTITASDTMPRELTKLLVTPYWAVVDSEGVTITDIGTYECDSDNSQLSDIQPGNTYKVHAVFDVPEDAQTLAFQANTMNASGWEWTL